MTHLEHAKKHNISGCTPNDITYGGKCFRCGYDPKSYTEVTAMSTTPLFTERDKASFIEFFADELSRDIIAKEEEAVRQRNSCKQCGLYANADIVNFGGSPQQGWYEVKRIDGSSRIPRSTNNGPWKFCSKKCLVEFLTNKKEVTNG